MINVLLTAVELYLQWQLSKSENELEVGGTKTETF